MNLNFLSKDRFIAAKGGFFSESPKNYPELEIWISQQQLSVIGGKFKFQAQDSFLEHFFWRLGDLKNESHFLKKATFSQSHYLSNRSYRYASGKE